MGLDGIKYAFIDTEISLKDKKVHDIGALRHDGGIYHGRSESELMDFLSDLDYVCGHNIVEHDARYLFGDESKLPFRLVDTLYLSPLLFPARPYHRLVKDDKLVTERLNNPVNDCIKANDLLMDEITAWKNLPSEKRSIYVSLLNDDRHFSGFFDLAGEKPARVDTCSLIKQYYKGRICSNADISGFIERTPCELAYSLAVIDTMDVHSLTPKWVFVNYPQTVNIINALCHTRCQDACEYCRGRLDARANLKLRFGYDGFRTYAGEPLQEMAVNAAIDGKSLLAIFPTGGGKSLTFQLPAMIAGDTVRGLTVIISPLQSLMKDQVDNLIQKGVTEAATINGLLDPLSRANAIQRVSDGDVSMLYISPEMLRSNTIQRLLQSRHVVRFVIDEAHCFSSWGQDFRVDYMYIGKFIKEYQQAKRLDRPVPVSCFTATAKQKVIQDICDYFSNTVGLNLELFTTEATRTNLRYSVIHVNSDDEKYEKLRDLISASDCPTIVYVSRTRRTLELAEHMRRDGIDALPFNGKMDPETKIKNQEAFMSGRTQVIVATSAFGMGVDKSDVGLVVHYDISDSLENYVQEAGRAARDPNLQARCFVLYNDNDLDKHFILLNQTKLSLSEIQQVWKAIKDLTRQRDKINCSALEIARQAGWDDSVNDIETRVRTAVAALEQGGYLKRGNNSPHVYATGILVDNMDEARQRIASSPLFENNETETAAAVIKSLITQKYTSRADDAMAESRVDYLADVLGLTKSQVISVIERMRQEGILADSLDMTAYVANPSDFERRSRRMLNNLSRLERHLTDTIASGCTITTFKQLNDSAVNAGIAASTEKDIRTLLYFLAIKGYIKNKHTAGTISISLNKDHEAAKALAEKRHGICGRVIDWISEQLAKQYTPADVQGATKNVPIQFSMISLLDHVNKRQDLFSAGGQSTLPDLQEALLYLTHLGVVKLDGGFMVIYNSMSINRIKDLKSRYRQADYSMLDQFYKHKIQQIHIVGEYANLMVRDYNAALQYVSDYFRMDYRKFIAKYFKGERTAEIQMNITPEKYHRLFGELSDRQREIINDKESRCIVVAAAPGSGKTRVLVHKLASLLLLEDVKHEQLLMLTFSRSTATEFKQRLIGLIGNAAHFVEIKTFHAYSFDLLGRVGNLEDSANVVARAAEMIETGQVEPNRIAKTVLVIDEAQDIGNDEYRLIKALMLRNEEMRVIAVGDDDQGIFEFRGSDSRYMYQLAKASGSKLVEMNENFRSDRHPVKFANMYATTLRNRIKSSPIVSVSVNDGFVAVTQHESAFLYEAIVNDLIRRRGEGTSCILTQTNEEALMISALLKRRGVRCSLIQTMDGLRFCNLAEIRYFIRYIESRGGNPVIGDELWQQAVKATRRRYDRSECMAYVERCIELFSETNRTRYLSDFKEYVFESSLEDFSNAYASDVVVSTIHKAKGREYNDVYLLLANTFGQQDENRQRRSIYVGITRAKNRLMVHTANSQFAGIDADEYTIDKTPYPMPDEILLQLGHKDVYLDFFKGLKPRIMALQSGDSLIYDKGTFYDCNGDAVVRVSMKMQAEIGAWIEKGYQPSGAKTRLIVAWRAKDEGKDVPETAVLLPDLALKFVK